VKCRGDILHEEHLEFGTTTRLELALDSAPRLLTDEPQRIPTLAEAERELVGRAIVQTRGHRGKAAALLGISPRTLQRKLRLFGLDKS
jgi:DNA-binding NtrC family response regulator